MPTPEAPPRAAIVRHYDRGPLPLEVLEAIGPRLASTKWRDVLRWGIPPESLAPIPDGQLWQREAERDAREHGEAVKAGRLEAVRRGGRVSDDHEFPSSKRGFIREQIERRRPAMRARRAELEAARPCPSCDGAGEHPEVDPSPDRPDMVRCPDCWGAGLYVGSLSQYEDVFGADWAAVPEGEAGR